MTKKTAKHEVKISRFERLASLGGMAAKFAADAAVATAKQAVFRSEDALRAMHEKTALGLVETLGSMKGLPMKIGQIMSFMDGVIPPAYQETYQRTLSNLQTKVKPLPFAEMEQVFLQEHGRAFQEAFKEYSEEPIAAASIGQVYKARLHNGRSVAVKIQYPGIAEAVTGDLKTVRQIIATMSRLLPGLDIDQMVSDFLSRFAEECNYELEASHQRAFRGLWQDDPRVVVPRVIQEFSSKRVLVTEFQDGKSFEEFLATATRDDLNAAGATLFWFAFRSILSHGVFNGDPHPGNYLFFPDGRIVFLDFGCVQHYSDESRAALRQVIAAVLAGKHGDALWNELVSALQFRPGEHDAIRQQTEDLLLFCFKPVLDPQPFTFTRAYTSAVADMVFQLKFKVAKHVVRSGWQEPKLEGLVLLTRIIVGMNSILARMEATADWRALIDAAGESTTH